jgi:hypothetical protein
MADESYISMYEPVFDNDVSDAAIEDALMHYGVKRRSGRYPWGSGENPFQHSGDFLARVEQLRSEGVTYTDEDGKVYTGETAIAKTLGMTTTDLRMQERVAKHERRQLQADRAKSLRDDGYSLNEIAEKMGFANDSSVRALLNEDTATNKNRANVTADTLEAMIKEKKMLDVGAGVERELGVSEGTLKEALFILQTRGYNVYGVGIPQVTQMNKQTITSVLADKDVEYKEAYNYGDIQSVTDYHSDDGGTTFQKTEYPASIDSSRVYIHYGDETLNGTKGTDKDGVIEIRPGCADLDLGNQHYAQVRIMVDGTHYLKGMAMYSTDIPDGYDIVFNTNKASGTAMTKVLKEIKSDPENPFGATIKPGVASVEETEKGLLTAAGQYHYKDSNGNEKLGAINKIKGEGAWDDMSKNLSSQFLSKQSLSLIRKQLDYTYKDAEAEFDEIMSLTNGTVKKSELLEFANTCDGAVKHLKAAALPRQSTKVILPMTCIKDDEIYAPTYKDGEQVALVRYPHGGTFEIPVLTVNNKSRKARSILDPTCADAVGITPKTAAQLSGADFDGDQVIVIPTNSRVKITARKALSGLADFEPKTAYATDEKIVNGKKVYVNAAGNQVKIMSEKNKQNQMGQISNLITDMTLGGASDEELTRAVKHSMVVIDAAKHKLDYKQSEKDNGIAELKQKWQVRTTDDGDIKTGGASTLLSRRKQTIEVPERQGSAQIDKETGEVSYKTSGRTYVDKKTGKTKLATTSVSLLETVSDLNELSSGTPQEKAYADYGNKMKALANKARKEAMATQGVKVNTAAKKTYAQEVASLSAKVDQAARNAPRERRAQALANSKIKALIQENPSLKNDSATLKKLKNKAIIEARGSVSASGKANRITVTDREWEAIQAGAISDNMLQKVLRYADSATIKQKALPKTTTSLSSYKIAKLKNMAKSGMYTRAEIAEALGISPSTVSKYINS